jgi:hypothetical protein
VASISNVFLLSYLLLCHRFASSYALKLARPFSLPPFYAPFFSSASSILHFSSFPFLSHTNLQRNFKLLHIVRGDLRITFRSLYVRCTMLVSNCVSYNTAQRHYTIRFLFFLKKNMIRARRQKRTRWKRERNKEVEETACAAYAP